MKKESSLREAQREDFWKRNMMGDLFETKTHEVEGEKFLKYQDFTVIIYRTLNMLFAQHMYGHFTFLNYCFIYYIGLKSSKTI